MHRFYYNHTIPGDVLFILLEPNEKVISSVKKGDVTILYGEKGVVGYNIFNASSYVSNLKDGAIFQEDQILLSKVNAALIKANEKPLGPNSQSGYIVATITKLEEHPLLEKSFIVTLSIGEKEVTSVSSYKNLEVSKKVVVITDGTLDKYGNKFSSHVEKNIPIDVLIASPLDLKLEGDNDQAYLVNLEEGVDFFA